MSYTKDMETKIKRALADLVYNHKDEVKFVKGKPSYKHLSFLLKEKYKLNATRQLVSRYIDAGVEQYRKTIVVADNDKLREIIKAMAVQQSIWDNDRNTPSARTQASKAWSMLQKQRIEYEKQLTDAKLAIAAVSRPNYLIKFEAPHIMMECPKCKHKWYMSKALEENEEDKGKFKFKSGKGQNSFDEFTEEEDGNTE